ncbi:hypothetical protein [Streptomyces sp. NPDC096153]|uniref:hypothetical protein n=1 Tax=Streptomyces sp. NPDC096153 TaxID=3155548 RepID=UPI003317B13A
MFTIHLVAYTATRNDGLVTHGVGRVGTDHDTPTAAECVEQIPGYTSGHDLGREPQYKLTYETARGPVERTVGSAGILRHGRILMRLADKGQVWNIEVFDAAGIERTFEFAIFCC